MKLINVVRWYSHGVSVLSIATAVTWTAWERYRCATTDMWCLIAPEHILILALIVAGVVAALLRILDYALAAHYADSRTSEGDAE